MYMRRANYRKLKGAILALQCATRVRIAKKELKGLTGEQKDIGKLKENNDKLKMEMQSLKAMLAAQAKEGASSLAHTKEVENKQNEIDELEKRVLELEKQLASETALVEKLEADLKLQNEQAFTVAAQYGPSSSPRAQRMSGKSPAVQQTVADISAAAHMQMPTLPSSYVSPEVVAQHRSHLAHLQEELKAERNLRREADGEIIKLRAAINGVQLNDSEVDALLAQKLEAAPKKKESQRYVVDWQLFEYRSVGWLVGWLFCLDCMCDFVPPSSAKSAFLFQLLYEHVAHYFVQIRFVVIVLLALVVTIVAILYLIQRRSAGAVPRQYLKLLGETTDFDAVLGPVAS
jgi:cobalamin biosynthesis Mg chelatase CobN